ncbi:guanine nucleotide exchange factor for Rab-3A-like isoform X1 [Haemaphysalis longicornis]
MATMADASSDGLLMLEPQHAEESSSCEGGSQDASLDSAGLGCGLPGSSPNGTGAAEQTARSSSDCGKPASSGPASPTPLAVPDGGVCQAPLPRPPSQVVSNGLLPEGSSAALACGAEHALGSGCDANTSGAASASAETPVGPSERLAGLQPAGLAQQTTSCAEVPAERSGGEPDRGSPDGPQEVQLRKGCGSPECDPVASANGPSGSGGKHSVLPNGDVSRGCGPAASEGVPAARRRSASDGAVQENGWAHRGRSSHSECNGLDRRVAIPGSAGSSSSSSGSTEGPDSPVAEEGEGLLGSGVRWSGGGRSVSEVKELAYARLQAELSRAQQELRLRDEEVARLSQIRDQVGAELEELTASLFEEANNMVREANMKQAAAEKRLQEATLQVEVLQAEVSALKALVLTSTPSRPNAHLHPQLGRHRHRRSPSNYELATCRPPSPPPSSQPLGGPLGVGGQPATASTDSHDLSEADPVCQREFGQWQEGSRAVADRGEPFVARLYREDVLPCLHFPAAQLAAQVLRAIEDNCITIEAVHSANPFPRRCSLLEVPRICQYRMRLGDSGAPWHHISQLCRNRITSVCDLFCYLRYIQQGLVRSSLQEMYWEVMRRRRSIALARLGLPG